MGRTQTYEWWKRFKEGRTSVDDDPRSGRPSTSKTDDNVAKVCEVIRSNRRLTIREVAEEVSISKTVCHEILTENLDMHRIAAKFVPHLLTDDQKQNRVDVTSWPNTRRLSFHSLPTLQISHQLTFLFPKLKSTLKGRRFESIEAIKTNSLAHLRSIPKKAFQECFRTLKKRWQRCIQSRGEYSEGNKAE